MVRFSPGPHALAASAYYPAGQFTNSTTNRFSVLATNNVVDQYDAAGYVTNRVFANGKTQFLTWDAAGRLVGLTQWDNSTNGFFWTAIYDPAGRRVRTIEVPVVNGYTNVVGTLTEDAYFDPQVEFEEVGVGVNGRRTWEVLGPDLDGAYGSFQGVGGLEATVRESDGATTPVLNDYFGNVLAGISGGSVELRAGGRLRPGTGLPCLGANHRNGAGGYAGVAEPADGSGWLLSSGRAGVRSVGRPFPESGPLGSRREHGSVQLLPGRPGEPV